LYSCSFSALILFIYPNLEKNCFVSKYYGNFLFLLFYAVVRSD